MRNEMDGRTMNAVIRHLQGARDWMENAERVRNVGNIAPFMHSLKIAEECLADVHRLLGDDITGDLPMMRREAP